MVQSNTKHYRQSSTAERRQCFVPVRIFNFKLKEVYILTAKRKQFYICKRKGGNFPKNGIYMHTVRLTQIFVGGKLRMFLYMVNEFVS